MIMRSSFLNKFFLAIFITSAFVSAALSAETNGQGAPPAPKPAAPSFDKFVQDVRQDTQWFSSFPTRVVGTPEHAKAREELLAKLNAIEGIEVWTEDFPVVMPQFTESKLTITEGEMQGEHRIYPFWPTAGRLNSTPAEGITGKLMYVGNGKYGLGNGFIPAKGLRGNIAVIEAAGKKAWQEAFNAGAKAVIVLGQETDVTDDFTDHIIEIPANLPRFYVPEGELANRLRTGSGSGKIYAKGEWKTVTAKNIYALVYPQRPMEADCPIYYKQALTFAVPYDSMSVVPEVAPGADAAIDVAISLNLLRNYAQSPPQFRPVMFAFVDAYTINQRGVREMLGTYATFPGDGEALQKDEDVIRVEYEKHAEDLKSLYSSTSGGYAVNWIITAPVILVGLVLFGLLMMSISAKRFALSGTIIVLIIAGVISVIAFKSNLKKKVTLEGEETLISHRNAIERLYEPQFRELRQYVKDEIARDLIGFEAKINPLRLEEFALAKEVKRLELELEKKNDLQITGQIEKINERKKELAASQEELSKQKSAVNSIQRAILSDEQLSDKNYLLAETIWLRAKRRIELQYQTLQERRALTEHRFKLREELCRKLGIKEQEEGMLRKKGVPLGFILNYDLSDNSVVCGPRFYDTFLDYYELRNQSPEAMRRWLTLFETGAQLGGQPKEPLWPKRLFPNLQMNAVYMYESIISEILDKNTNFTSPCASFNMPAATWATLEGFTRRLDTPNDSFEKLNWDNLSPQIEATFLLTQKMVADPRFAAMGMGKSQHTKARGSILDQAPGEPLARVPMEGYLTTLGLGYFTKLCPIFFNKGACGIRRLEYAFTGVDGQFEIDLIPGYRGDYRAISWFHILNAYRINEDGSIGRTIDMLKMGRGVRVATRLSDPAPNPMRAVVFDCKEQTLTGLVDQRFMLWLPEGSLLDSVRGSNPQRQNFSRCYPDDITTFQLEPNIKWQFILRHGLSPDQNRLALINMIDTDDPYDEAAARNMMKGFAVGEALPDIAAYVSARDLFLLDSKRLQDYRRAGIVSVPLEELQKNTRNSLKQAEDARAADDGAGFISAATSSLANEIRVYSAVRITAKDVIKGAIFLLLMIVPFSFVMERLVFSSANIYRQIGSILIIFGVMTGLLWSFHPAFRISSQPLMIIMAFAAIGMSLMVITMLFSKFETQLEELRSGRAEASGARTSRFGLACTAIRLGIANMRKRKLRTALTGITIMLITFALLCFMSTTSYNNFNDRTKEGTPSFSGVQLSLPASRDMSPATLDMLKYQYPGREIAPKFWWVTNDNQWRLRIRSNWDTVCLSFTLAPDASMEQIEAWATAEAKDGEYHSLSTQDNSVSLFWRFDSPDKAAAFDAALNSKLAELPFAAPESAKIFPNTNRTFSIKGALAVAGIEGKLSGLNEICPNWEKFDKNSCYLSKETAQEIGVKAGDKITLAGRELTVLGVYDYKTFDQSAKKLDTKPIRPNDYSIMQQEQLAQTFRTGVDQLSQDIESKGIVEQGENAQYLSSRDFVLLHADTFPSFRESLKSITIPTANHEESEKIAKELAVRFSFPIYYGSPEKGLRVVVSKLPTPTPPKSIIIPLIIAGLIILNTMLSSIAERKREIYIYTSLGLAPLHVGFLFLAEAVTYGLIGSIFGYVVGQGVAKVLSELGMMGNISLNYSGGQAVMTMLMVIGVVVVSSLVPAFLASKLATPSNEMTWKVPQPVNDVIKDKLPFTATRKTAGGVLQFIREYFEAHSESAIGTFSTDNIQMFKEDRNGSTVIGLECTIWLAPYDLGIRQHGRIEICETADGDVYEINVQLTRQAGQVRSWWKLNRVLLGDLRKQLLGWRKLKMDAMLEFITRAAEAGVMPQPELFAERVN